MLRVERIDLMVSGTVSSLMSIVNTIMATPGMCTTELIPTRIFSSKCHQTSQIVPNNCKVISYAARRAFAPLFHRVDAPVIPGVAAHDPPHGHPAALDHTIFFDSFVP